MTHDFPEESNDAQAVAAVCNGDLDRYRELITRYERRVYAVAWARLGDRDLAEEATQEAFVKAFRHLGFLKKGGRFAAWIIRITRNVAINLGIRRRHELEKRRRWALESLPHVEDDRRNESKEAISEDLLRESLAHLPAMHRESLVLFYLEGKSISEAAAVLQITEAAFKTRLHRARAALREQLELKLEDSLADLRPRRAIAPLVIASIGVTSAQAVSGAGGAILAAKGSSGFLKFIPFPVMMVSIWLIGAIPGVLLGYWIGRLEKQNYRDQRGFRARIYQSLLVKTMLLVPLFMGGFFFLASWGQSKWGPKAFFQILTLVSFLALAVSSRLLVINRNRFILSQVAGLFLMTCGFLVIGFTSSPVTTFPVFLALVMMLMIFGFPQRPLRMDYNLFLRSTEGMLPQPTHSENQSGAEVTREDTFRFARFLGERWLVNDYRSGRASLMLRLIHVRPRAIVGSWLFVWRCCSSIELRRDGTVSASLGSKDARDLEELTGRSVPDPALLEKSVAGALMESWNSFRVGALKRAGQLLGEGSEEAIFVQPSSRAKGRLWGRRVLIAALVLQLILLALTFHTRPAKGPGAHLRPVSATESEVRATLRRLEKPRAIEPQAWQITDFAPVMLLAFPPKELFTTAAWTNLTSELWPAGASVPAEVQKLLSSPVLLKAAHDGLFTVDDLAARGITTASFRSALLNLAPRELARYQQLPQSHGTYKFYITTEAVHRISLFARFDSLDFLDRNTIVGQLRSSQALTAAGLKELNPNLTLGHVRGLFINSPYDPLRDSYRALTILSLLGALDQIDREACVQGILRLHLGKGQFGIAQNDPSPFFLAEAQNTWCAFESLRLLQALSRINDLDEWEFRPLMRIRPDQPLNPMEIEAWIFREKFRQTLKMNR